VPRTLDAVLPLTLSDAERAQILFRSLERFFEPLGTCFVVAPAAELDALRAHVPGGRYELLPEDELVPELRRHQARGRLLARLWLGMPAHGWHVQQLVKLAAADLVASDAYLTLDADVICARPTGYDDLVGAGGRAVAQLTPPHHPEWNDTAAELLGLPRSGRQHGVTPAVLARAGVQALAQHLEDRSGEPWRRHLLRRLPWTEYSLYGTFLEGAGRWEELHLDGGEEALYGNGVWIHGQWAGWEPAAFFGDPASPPFTVVQSATWIRPEDVWARVEPYVAPSKRGESGVTSRSAKEDQDLPNSHQPRTQGFTAKTLRK
jgi:hypothetical protein